MNVSPGFRQGQTTSANSLPVVIASDQSAVPVSGTVTVTNPSVGTTGAAAPASATEAGGVFNTSLPTLTNGQLGALQLDSSSRQIISAIANALPAGTNVIGHVIVDSGTIAATQSGTWTVQPGNTANTTPWLMTINQGGNSASVTGANALKVDGSAVTQPVSGTVTANAGTGTFAVSIAANQSATASNSSVSNTTSDQTALASNSSRKAAILYNNSDSAHVFVNYGATATTTTAFVVRIDPRATLMIDAEPVYTGSLHVISDVANGALQVTELT